jgi:regulator of RNase E activity RraA
MGGPMNAYKAAAAETHTARADLEAAFAGISSCSLSDVLDDLGIPRVLSTAVTAQNAHKRFVGEAYTVRWDFVRKNRDIMSRPTSTWDEVKDFLAPNLKQAAGSVYVAGAGALVNGMALAGGMSLSYFQARGFAAVVLGGAVRDADIVRNADIPVFASALTPADTQGCMKVAAVGSSCWIENLEVRTGDIVFGDESGVVVIPRDRLHEVVAAAREIEEKEARMMSEIASGRDLYEMITRNGRI